MSAKTITIGIQKQISELRDKLKEMIEKMPTVVKGVQPLNKKGNFASVSFSTIAKNNNILLAESKAKLKKLIDTTPLEYLGARIENIIQTGYILYPNGNRMRLNPEFIKKLTELWRNK